MSPPRSPRLPAAHSVASSGVAGDDTPIVGTQVVGTHADHTVTVRELAPVTPEWLRRASDGPHPAQDGEDACPVCLCSMHAVYVWPSCGHLLHLGCVAHMRVNQAWVSCPICRSGWSEVAERQITQMCRQEAVPVPEAAADYDTNSAQIPAEPPAPAGVVALCCHHLALTAPKPNRKMRGSYCQPG